VVLNNPGVARDFFVSPHSGIWAAILVIGAKVRKKEICQPLLKNQNHQTKAYEKTGI